MKSLRILFACALWMSGFGASPIHAALVQGFVRDEKQRPIPAATVLLRVEAGDRVFTIHTGSDGSYRIEQVPAGSYTLRAEMGRFGKTAFGPFIVAQKDVKRIDLTLTPASASGAPDFFDEPTFVVAGVTESAYQGGHGSDVILRSTEALTEATGSLGRESRGDAESITSLREAVARQPDVAELHHRLANADEKLGNPLEAVREYQRAAELEASENNLFDWGTELLKHRADQQAMEVFAKGNRLFPTSTRMLLGLAAASYGLGSYDQAARFLFAACDIHPTDPTPYLFLGKVQSTAITTSDGFVERLRRFSVLHPENALANYYYAVSLWGQRKMLEDSETPAKVRALLEKAIRIDPKAAAAYVLLGSVYSDGGDFAQAIASFQKAIELSPGLEEAHFRLAQAYLRAGDTVKAQKEMDLHRELSKSSAEAMHREQRDLQRFVFALREQ